jgi:hypothetical protein
MIALANNTALLFDHKTETVRPVAFDGELHTLRQLLGVEMFDTIRLDSDHIIVVDDEGMLNKTPIGFAVCFNGHRVQFAGSGLLTGDSYGQHAPLSLNLSDLKISVLNFKYE